MGGNWPMTHNELLASIIDYGENGPIDYGQIDLSKALRAVVELHKPVETNYIDIETCTGCEEAEYPCPTIQAIEKELK